MARSDTACTDSHFLYLTILNTPDLLKVGIPAFLCFVVSMTNIITDNRSFTTNFTYL